MTSIQSLDRRTLLKLAAGAAAALAAGAALPVFRPVLADEEPALHFALLAKIAACNGVDGLSCCPLFTNCNRLQSD